MLSSLNCSISNLKNPALEQDGLIQLTSLKKIRLVLNKHLKQTRIPCYRHFKTFTFDEFLKSPLSQLPNQR